MRTLSGAVLILAAAIVYTGGLVCDTAFIICLKTVGGNPIFLTSAYADVAATTIGLVGAAFLVWGALTDPKRNSPT
jgi:hypothetical protein